MSAKKQTSARQKIKQDYMEWKGVERARMAFRLRARMVKGVKMNYKSMHRNNLNCEECDMNEQETQEHIMVCPGWAGERGSLDVMTSEDRVEFFVRVMKRKK